MAKIRRSVPLATASGRFRAGWYLTFSTLPQPYLIAAKPCSYATLGANRTIVAGRVAGMFSTRMRCTHNRSMSVMIP
jgi:hypothetical protein